MDELRDSSELSNEQLELWKLAQKSRLERRERAFNLHLQSLCESGLFDLEKAQRYEKLRDEKYEAEARELPEPELPEFPHYPGPLPPDEFNNFYPIGDDCQFTGDPYDLQHSEYANCPWGKESSATVKKIKLDKVECVLRARSTIDPKYGVLGATAGAGIWFKFRVPALPFDGYIIANPAIHLHGNVVVTKPLTGPVDGTDGFHISTECIVRQPSGSGKPDPGTWTPRITLLSHETLDLSKCAPPLGCNISEDGHLLALRHVAKVVKGRDILITVFVITDCWALSPGFSVSMDFGRSPDRYVSAQVCLGFSVLNPSWFPNDLSTKEQTLLMLEAVANGHIPPWWLKSSI